MDDQVDETIPGLAITRADSVLTIRFNRPDALNAFTGEMAVGTAGLLKRGERA